MQTDVRKNTNLYDVYTYIVYAEVYAEVFILKYES